MGRFALVNLIMSAAFLAWSLIAYRFLPDHPIADASEDALAAREVIRHEINEGGSVR